MTATRFHSRFRTATALATLAMSTCLSLSALPTPTQAASWPPAIGPSVYPGCSTPPTTSAGHTFYIDPMNGSASGDGSSAHPWNSLQALVTSINGASPLLSSVPYSHATAHGYVFSANASAPVKPGDTVLLMNGLYGDFSVNIYDQTIYNSAFVTVAAAPKQTPMFSSLTIGSTNKWLFQGLTVNGLASGYNALVTVVGQSVANPSQDIIFDSLNIATTANMSGWSAASWVANARMEGIQIGNGPILSTRCTTVRNSVIQNVRWGAALAGNGILFTRNVLNNLGDDFIDYAGSNLTITYNLLTNSNTIGDNNHNDFLQGQLGYTAPGVTTNQFSNILIDSNKAVRATSLTSVAFPGEIQGIDAFDSDWNNVTVSNNSIVTSTCQGISYYSLHTGLIVNNTLIDDNSGYGTKNAQGLTMCRPTIYAGGSSHEGSPSNAVTIRNNLAPGLAIINTTAAMAMDHNYCTPLGGSCQVVFTSNGKTNYLSVPGVYGDGKLISANTIQSGQIQDYATYSPATLTFDPDLAVGSPALTAGSATLMPALNINGVKRTAAGLGAY